jgi:hypothetical protein
VTHTASAGWPSLWRPILWGREGNYLFVSQNPAREHGGSCPGDSGGPLFYTDAQGVEIQVAVTATGDAVCRATGIAARTDAEQVVEFLACVMAPGAEVEDMLACGCTEVTDQGVCPGSPGNANLGGV